MENTYAVTETKRTTKEIAKAAFPDYKGRKFFQESAKPEGIAIHDNYWSEGSRGYYVAIRVSDLRSVELPGLNPMRGAECRVTLPGGVVLVRRSIFMGRECGLTVIAPAVPDVPAIAAKGNWA